MAEKFLMPKLSPTMEEGQISRWVIKEGDKFEANETLAEVDTDKATMEMTALSGGTLLKIIKGEGESAALGEAIAIIGEKGEDIAGLLDEISANGGGKKAKSSEKADGDKPAPEKTIADAEEQELSKTSAPEKTSSRLSARETTRTGETPETGETAARNGRMIVSPIAARMAGENNIDLRSIKGSGPNGRITAYLVPPGEGPFPAVVFMHGSTGYRVAFLGERREADEIGEQHGDDTPLLVGEGVERHAGRTRADQRCPALRAEPRAVGHRLRARRTHGTTHDGSSVAPPRHRADGGLPRSQDRPPIVPQTDANRDDIA